MRLVVSDLGDYGLAHWSPKFSDSRSRQKYATLEQSDERESDVHTR